MGILETIGSKLGIPTREERREESKGLFWMHYGSGVEIPVTDDLNELKASIQDEVEAMQFDKNQTIRLAEEVSGLAECGEIKEGRDLLIGITEDGDIGVDCI